jgi:hypothetical protein
MARNIFIIVLEGHLYFGHELHNHAQYDELRRFTRFISLL